MLSAKGRRMLNRLKSKVIDLTDAMNVTKDASSDTTIVIDSGTVYHILKSKEKFASVSKSQIKIKG